MHRRQLISRRGFINSAGALVAPFLASGHTQTTEAAPISDNDFHVRLVKEIKNAQLLDLSPDGTKLCMYSSRNPVRSFRWNGETWRESKTPIRDGDEALRIISRDSWAQTYATRLPALPYYASFFADGMAIYVGIPGITEAGQNGDVHLIVDPRDSQPLEHFARYSPTAPMFFYHALRDRMLLGAGNDAKVNRTEVVVLAKSPTFEETRRAPFAENRVPGTRKTETSITVSAERTTFAYGVDDKVVFRDASDLSVIWTSTMKPSLELWCVAISKRYVAASSNDGYTGDGPPLKRVQEGYVGLFDAVTGKELTRIYADATEGLAISPDERLLAIGQRVYLPGKTSGTQPTVLLFEIASGKKVATVIHDQFREGGHEFLHAGVMLRFTPDGKYLITSGRNTKIWQLG